MMGGKKLVLGRQQQLLHIRQHDVSLVGVVVNLCFGAKYTLLARYQIRHHDETHICWSKIYKNSIALFKKAVPEG